MPTVSVLLSLLTVTDILLHVVLTAPVHLLPLNEQGGLDINDPEVKDELIRMTTGDDEEARASIKTVLEIRQIHSAVIYNPQPADETTDECDQQCEGCDCEKAEQSTGSEEVQHIQV